MPLQCKEQMASINANNYLTEKWVNYTIYTNFLTIGSLVSKVLQITLSNVTIKVQGLSLEQASHRWWTELLQQKMQHEIGWCYNTLKENSVLKQCPWGTILEKDPFLDCFQHFELYPTNRYKKRCPWGYCFTDNKWCPREPFWHHLKNN